MNLHTSGLHTVRKLSRQRNKWRKCSTSGVSAVSFSVHGWTACAVKKFDVRRSNLQFIRSRCLKLFGHMVRACPNMDHYRALTTGLSPLSSDWKRLTGRRRLTCLRLIESVLRPLNTGQATSEHSAKDRETRRSLAETAIRQLDMLYCFVFIARRCVVTHCCCCCGNARWTTAIRSVCWHQMSKAARRGGRHLACDNQCKHGRWPRGNRCHRQKTAPLHRVIYDSVHQQTHRPAGQPSLCPPAN